MADLPGRRWLALLGGPLLFALMLALPWLAAQAVPDLKPDDRLLVSSLPEAFGTAYWLWCGGALLISLVLLFARQVQLHTALRVSGLLAGAAVAVFLLPIVGEMQQAPIRNAGLLARTLPGRLVLYETNTPSFQTYAGRQVDKLMPQPNDLVLTRESELAKLPGATVIYRERSYVLARMPAEKPAATQP
jgi:hypothetical protein